VNEGKEKTKNGWKRETMFGKERLRYVESFHSQNLIYLNFFSDPNAKTNFKYDPFEKKKSK